MQYASQGCVVRLGFVTNLSTSFKNLLITLKSSLNYSKLYRIISPRSTNDTTLMQAYKLNAFGDTYTPTPTATHAHNSHLTDASCQRDEHIRALVVGLGVRGQCTTHLHAHTSTTCTHSLSTRNYAQLRTDMHTQLRTRSCAHATTHKQLCTHTVMRHAIRTLQLRTHRCAHSYAPCSEAPRTAAACGLTRSDA